MPIKLSINVLKVSKDRLYAGKNGAKYLSAILIENKNGPDEYGNAGMIVEDVTKEERESGVKGVILGNYKHLGQKPTGGQRSPAPAQRPKTFAKPPVDPDLDGEDSPIPF